MTTHAASNPRMFATRSHWRHWLKLNHATSPGLWLMLYKKQYQRGLSYPDAVEEALCFGWIDGQLRRIDDRRHMLRFTPRRPNSIWAPSNIARVKKLIAARRMTRAGLNAWRSANPNRQVAPDATKPTSLVVPPDLGRALKRNSLAWKHWQLRPPSTRRIAIWWVRTAKQPATRLRRIRNIVRNTARYARSHY